MSDHFSTQDSMERRDRKCAVLIIKDLNRPLLFPPRPDGGIIQRSKGLNQFHLFFGFGPISILCSIFTSFQKNAKSLQKILIIKMIMDMRHFPGKLQKKKKI